MKTCVEIEFDDQTGQISVGVCPPKEEMGAQDQMMDQKYLKPVQSLGQAVQFATQVIQGAAQGAQARAQQPAAASRPGMATFR